MASEIFRCATPLDVTGTVNSGYDLSWRGVLFRCQRTLRVNSQGSPQIRLDDFLRRFFQSIEIA